MIANTQDQNQKETKLTFRAPAQILDGLATVAHEDKRSINGELLWLVEWYLHLRTKMTSAPSQTDQLDGSLHLLTPVSHWQEIEDIAKEERAQHLIEKLNKA